jgi:uncharacterized protein (DUF934 family)
MPLLELGRLVPDRWIAAADDAPLSEGTPALVSFARLLRDADVLTARNAALGVTLPNDVDPAALTPFLGRLALVALRFPKHRDGRAFTQARGLRERHGFAGEIRATGHVLPDQHAALLRCGFTAVEMPEGADLAAWQRGLHAMPTAYQPAVAGDAAPLGLLRRHVAVG